MNKNILHISDLIFYKKTYDEIIEFLMKNKIENVEMFVEPLDKEYTSKMLKILENYKFTSLSFHGPFRKCDISKESEKNWQDAIISYEESFKIATKYNVKHIVLHTNEGIAQSRIDNNIKNIIETRIIFLNEMAKKYNVNLVVENVGIRKNMIFSQEEYTKLILKNKFNCLIDIGHAFANEWNIEKLIKDLKDNILGYHFHNNDGIHDLHKPINEGRLNYHWVIELVKKYTNRATIVLEYDFNEEISKIIEDYKLVEKLLK